MKKLNPEIREKAEELFSLIECEIKKSDEDSLAEAMSAQLGDFIKTSKGFDQLLYAFEISQTRYEQAIYGLEAALHRFKEKDLNELYKFCRDTLRLSKTLLGEDNIHKRYIPDFAKRVKKKGEKLMKYISNEYTFRTKDYREELDKLKEAS